MRSLTRKAPAKLNLFLHITGRKADGYHELQTVFQFLDLSDEICCVVREDGLVRRCHGPAQIPEEQDLVVRAANALKRLTGCKLGVDISTRKAIPMGGGLGGGSSDAATVLVSANELWGLNLSSEELCLVGLELGADVPVFVRGYAAWGEGVGERLAPVFPPELWYVVVRPACSVSTAEIFCAPELTRDSIPMKITGFFRAGSGGLSVSHSQFLGDTRNDCAETVRGRYPQVDEALNWLGGHGWARLTGTGSCVFGGFDAEDDARRVFSLMPTDWQGFVAKGLNRSPLFQ